MVLSYFVDIQNSNRQNIEIQIVDIYVHMTISKFKL
jgi:hypothetical protein